MIFFPTWYIVFDREDVIKRVIVNLDALYRRLERGEKRDIEREYVDTMYHLGEPHTYAYPDGEKFVATIRGVRHSGELCLEHRDGTIREYAFKEVEFVLPHKSCNTPK